MRVGGLAQVGRGKREVGGHITISRAVATQTTLAFGVQRTKRPRHVGAEGSLQDDEMLKFPEAGAGEVGGGEDLGGDDRE